MGCNSSKSGSAAVASTPAAAEPVTLLTQQDADAKAAQVPVTAVAEAAATPAAASEAPEARSSAVVELVAGEKAKLKKQGTMGTVLQTTTTDVQVKMEDGTVAWHEIEDLAQVTPDLKVGALVKLKKHGTICTVMTLTTTDVQVKLDDGTTEWHEIEDLLAHSESAEAVVREDAMPPLEPAETITETAVVAVPVDTMVLEEVPVNKGTGLCCI